MVCEGKHLDKDSGDCLKESFCDWQQGIDFKALREHWMNRDLEEINP